MLASARPADRPLPRIARARGRTEPAALLVALVLAAAAFLWLHDREGPLAAPSAIIFRTSNLERLFSAMCRAQQAHIVLLQALRQREVMRAEALMAEHIYQSREVVHREIRETGPSRPEMFPALSRPNPIL